MYYYSIYFLFQFLAPFFYNDTYVSLEIKVLPPKKPLFSLMTRTCH